MTDEAEEGKARAVPADGTDGPQQPDVPVDDGDAAVGIRKFAGATPVSAATVDGPDEPEADAGSAGSERESELVGAAAGSARAAARRSGVLAGSTPVKGVATRTRDSGRDARLGLFARLRRFLREVVAELRKVIWPARNQMVTYTIVVIVFVVVMVALTAGLDVLFAKGVLAIFG